MSLMGHFRQIDPLPTLSACRFAPIASEPSHRSNSTRCANCGHPVNNNVVRMSFVLLVSVFGVATPVG
jgi:hypothetical protein